MPVDHDAYGACGLLIKTPVYITYTGDIRLHGYRKEDTLKFCKESENMWCFINRRCYSFF